MPRCWWITSADEARALRILRLAGPVDGVGVVTGLIEDVSGIWAS